MQTLADVLRQKGMTPPPSDLEDLDLQELVEFARQCEAEQAALQGESVPQDPSQPDITTSLSMLSF
jgi:hypothetical protein